MKKNINFAILIFALFSVSACQKNFLSRNPQDAYSNSSLWTDASDAEAALAGVYNGQDYNFSDNGPSWADGTGIVYFDCMSDNGYSQYPWEEFQAYGNGSINPTSGDADMWSYVTIQKCNFFLANVGNTPISTTFTVTLRNQMIAQVRFIRAYEYFMMSQLYGDVPLITTSLTPAQANVSVKTPKADITKFVLSELTAAAPDLAKSYIGTPNQGQITQGAALALKARVELYEADYADCITDCQAVMQLGYSLDPSYSDLFRIQNQYTNPEIIAAAQYVENPSANSNFVIGVTATNSMGGWSSIDPLQSLVDCYEMSNGKVITDPTSGYDPTNPYANRDPRLSATILVPGGAFKYAGATTTSYYDPLDSSSPDYYASGNNTSPTGYIVKKYISNLSDFDNIFQSGLNMTVIRYAEVLLSYAEAKIESNQIDATVYSAINLVRNRAGMPNVDQTMYNTQATLRSLIRRERRVEFAFEGLRYFDIQRWKIGPQVMVGNVYGARLGTVNATTGQYTITGDSIRVETRQFADKNYLWPVPQSEININKNLTQNPGY
jgi:hypothetical protein